MKINFISQPYKSQQCGQACLAMVTNKTIDQVVKDLGRDWHTDIKQDIQFYLDRNSFKTRLISGEQISFDEVPDNSIIRLCYPSANGHFVVKHNGKYYDPSVGIVEQMISYVKITHYLTYQELKDSSK